VDVSLCLLTSAVGRFETRNRILNRSPCHLLKKFLHNLHLMIRGFHTQMQWKKRVF
jgi:hypothetical protein